MAKHVALVFGTRPEAVKLFPVVQALRRMPGFRVSVWATGQHRAMLDQVLSVAEIKPDLDFDLMRPNQTLDALTTRLLEAVGSALDRDRPDLVLVQGDTTSAMVATIACFYRKIRVGHVEAGLRTGNNYSPWPEEVNRKLISAIAETHFAPTDVAAANLKKENIDPRSVHVTGNTGIDALLLTRTRLSSLTSATEQIRAMLAPHERKAKILVTAHRRESFDGGLHRIASALRSLAERGDVLVLFPVHPNPNVSSVMRSELGDCDGVMLLDPLDYVPFVYLMSESKLILTDSGGIQEEAPSLGKPVLVLRETTERPEGVLAGTSKLVGTDSAAIIRQTFRLLDDNSEYEKMAKTSNPFGDGKASERIAGILHDVV